MQHKSLLAKIFEKEKVGVQKILDNIQYSDLKIFKKLCDQSLISLKNKKKIIFFGNGGSAADAQHLATELTVRYQKNRKAVAAISLATDTSALTAIGNDFGFKFIFSRQIEAIAHKNDICIAITTSGNSQNLIEACKVAKKMGLFFYVLSGNNGGKLKKICKNIILIPSKITSQIQVCEILLGQVLCEYIEKNIKKI
ncbi:MAG: phosphoheptose isomerase [Pelagibacteraceae bacterium]|jgi:D-sedoheptulose 7-phosphate isomerase|nr:phosphoheptose isomerase [Pelagibacteraceae bacterium]RZO87511.1 MAG: SIS domain-containing protein [alpha proteobacterium HIMB114]|tara:strand:- start:2168 stop:2758 length:591 start_codon:yes stop_codon:yes gene_type:complete